MIPPLDGIRSSVGAIDTAIAEAQQKANQANGLVTQLQIFKASAMALAQAVEQHEQAKKDVKPLPPRVIPKEQED